jgi:hypothetical protein
MGPALKILLNEAASRHADIFSPEKRKFDGWHSCWQHIQLF